MYEDKLLLVNHKMLSSGYKDNYCYLSTTNVYKLLLL
jgi:hypothetical protein